MKKILLTLSAIATLGFAANAQTEKGQFILGGQVSYDGASTKDSDDKSNAFSIMPAVGYFVGDNIAVGTAIGYGWSETETEALKSTQSAFQLAPFGRMYTGNYGPVKFFGQLSVPMAWGSVESNDEKEASLASYGVELAPGIAYFPTANIGLEFKVRGLYFNNASTTDEATDVKTTVNSYGLNVNSLAPSVGVTFLF